MLLSLSPVLSDSSQAPHGISGEGECAECLKISSYHAAPFVMHLCFGVALIRARESHLFAPWSPLIWGASGNPAGSTTSSRLLLIAIMLICARGVMGGIETALKAANRWVDEPTVEQVTEMYAFAEPTVNSITSSGRKRRVGQLCWRTLVRHKLAQGAIVE